MKSADNNVVRNLESRFNECQTQNPHVSFSTDENLEVLNMNIMELQKLINENINYSTERKNAAYQPEQRSRMSYHTNNPSKQESDFTLKLDESKISHAYEHPDPRLLEDFETKMTKQSKHYSETTPCNTDANNSFQLDPTLLETFDRAVREEFDYSTVNTLRKPEYDEAMPTSTDSRRDQSPALASIQPFIKNYADLIINFLGENPSYSFDSLVHKYYTQQYEFGDFMSYLNF